MMIPITRKEKYINEIVGGGDTAPETPQTREEFFFAEILGEVIAPSPVTRVEKYLSAIARQYSGDLPTPTTRIEYFLAKAAGMDITVPVPITREEIFWSNYTAIVEFEVEGVPPLTYKAIEGTLENYRIYGNTVNGENVGDLITEGEHAGEYRVPVTVEGKNLCNNIWEQGGIDGNTGNVVSSPNIVCCDFIPAKPDVTYSCSRTIANNFINLRCYGANKNYLGTGATLANKGNPLAYGDLFGTFMITDARVSYIRFNDYSNSLDTKYMLVEGIYTAETMPPYEPYHAPITTPVYLPEPIKIVGDEAEYIDYAEQKQHRVRKNLLQNTATSSTINGVTFTANEDGSVTCNGTATNIIEVRVSLDFLLPPGNYRLTGCPPGGWSSYPGGKVSYCLRTWYVNSGNVTWFFDYGDGCNFTLTDTKRMRSSIVIEKAQVVDNITFYPMIRKADIEDDTYEPYIENTEVGVTLPALPTLSGTNTLTVGTEVQPSDVYIKYEGAQ